MTPENKIEENIERFLRASGSSFRNYTMEKSRQELRNVMREIMSESYIAGVRSVADILEAEKNDQ